MKIRFIIKEQEEIKPVESPEQINIKRDNLKAEIQSELSALNLSTVTPEQLQNLLDQNNW
jgi:sRNA-binding carbon storage regulator CsrA